MNILEFVNGTRNSRSLTIDKSDRIGHIEGVEDDRALAECRSALYGLLANVYLLIPQSETLSIDWKPALRLLEFPQKGTERQFRDIEEGLNLV